MKKRAALTMLIALVDGNSGSLIINNDRVKRVFNDENEIVRIEYSTGEVSLLADADFETIDKTILKWSNDNPSRFNEIRARIK